MNRRRRTGSRRQGGRSFVAQGGTVKRELQPSRSDESGSVGMIGPARSSGSRHDARQPAYVDGRRIGRIVTADRSGLSADRCRERHGVGVTAWRERSPGSSPRFQPGPHRAVSAMPSRPPPSRGIPTAKRQVERQAGRRDCRKCRRNRSLWIPRSGLLSRLSWVRLPLPSVFTPS